MPSFLKPDAVASLAGKYGMLLFASGIPNYDPERFPDAEKGLVGEARLNFIHYLRLLGAKPRIQEISPPLDGVNHFNIYSNGKTEAGKKASNFYSDDIPFVTPDGPFLSLEGYYHWLRIRDWAMATSSPFLMSEMELARPALKELRTCSGAEAISKGRDVKKAFYGGSDYKVGDFSPEALSDFKCATAAKMHRIKVGDITLGNFLSSLVYHGVRITHYYVYDNKMSVPKFSDFLPNLIRELVVHIDPNDSTFDLDSLYDVIRKG